MQGSLSVSNSANRHWITHFALSMTKPESWVRVKKHTPRPVGDPRTAVKLSEVFRDRYTEQIETQTMKSNPARQERSHLQNMALFGITAS